MAVGGDGSVYVALGNAIEKVDRSGVLVASFGTAGRVTLQATAPVLDEAGNLYVISGAGIAKLDSAGHLLPSFGSNGYASLGSWGRGSQDVFSILVRDAAGNLYLGGYGRSPETGIFSGGVAKFDRDGHLVASFASSGVRILELGGETETPRAMAVDGGGNVFIAGNRLVKLDSSGNFAADFAAGGYWEVPDCANGFGAGAVSIDGTGSLVVGANCKPFSGGSSGFGRPLVFRLDAGGNVVASFRESGQRSGLLGTGTNTFGYVTTLLIGPSGHIYAAGYRDRFVTCAWDLAVTKLDANGNSLPAFDASDAVILEGQPRDFASDLGMDAAGRLYVGGLRMPCPQPRPIASTFVVYRLGA